jgi:transcriptional regulator with XRE-family HTH domain
MSDQTNRTENAGTGVSSALQEREKSNATEEDSLPIGAVLRRLRGERTLRDVQTETGIANSYLCNVELGYQQPGLKFLTRVAEYYQVGVAEIIRQAELLRNSLLDTEDTRIADVERSYQFIMDDPKLSACREPETPLSIEAKRHVVRMYELLTGKLLLH